ncbi:ribosome assembly RNA-binding protein YhbY [Thiospirillum jenense]|uniref:ribosome assembly RNA-binding protein YhbY n=1 Tax=Thiospirillum jenense TaxID=1653858 RepID=UPI001887CF4C|nr:ribosome assembly RNA-binding protein YhbY [Thiospirillum jenense]
MITLTDKQHRWLRQQAHPLKPVVILGQNGLTPAVLKEINGALTAHELIKIRINAADRDDRDGVAVLIAERNQAVLIQRIGNVACYYRANPKRRQPLVLPAI